MSSLVTSTAVTKATSVRDPDVMSAESKETSSGNFRMAPTPGKTNAAFHSSDARPTFTKQRKLLPNHPTNPSTCTGRSTNISRDNHQPLQDLTPRDDGATFQTTHQRAQNATANITRKIHQQLRDLTPRDDGAIFQPLINVCRTQRPPLLVRTVSLFMISPHVATENQPMNKKEPVNRNPSVTSEPHSRCDGAVLRRTQQKLEDHDDVAKLSLPSGSRAKLPEPLPNFLQGDRRADHP